MTIASMTTIESIIKASTITPLDAPTDIPISSPVDPFVSVRKPVERMKQLNSSKEVGFIEFIQRASPLITQRVVGMIATLPIVVPPRTAYLCVPTSGKIIIPGQERYYNHDSVIERASKQSYAHLLPRLELYRYNHLHSHMITRHQTKAASISASCSSLDVLDSPLIYKDYCQQRSAPTYQVLSMAPVVGMKVMTDSITDTISYVALFFPSWGVWICQVSPANVGGLIDVLDILGNHQTPVVHGGDDIRGLKQLLEPTPVDFTLPPIVDMRLDVSTDGNVPRLGTMAEMCADIFSVDTESWVVHVGQKRLEEDIPKNPLPDSFFPKWNLRTEQMTYLACEALLPLQLYIHLTNVASIIFEI